MKVVILVICCWAYIWICFVKTDFVWYFYLPWNSNLIRSYQSFNWRKFLIFKVSFICVYNFFGCMFFYFCNSEPTPFNFILLSCLNTWILKPWKAFAEEWINVKRHLSPIFQSFNLTLFISMSHLLQIFPKIYLLSLNSGLSFGNLLNFFNILIWIQIIHFCCFLILICIVGNLMISCRLRHRSSCFWYVTFGFACIFRRNISRLFNLDLLVFDL